MVYLFLLLSFALLYLGAELALNGAEKIGRYFKLSSFAIGVVLIGFGTSLPELFVSQISSYRKEYDVAIANIIGSNVFNLLFILGIVGLIIKIPMKNVKSSIIFQLLTAAMGFLVIFFKVNLITGIILLGVFGVYVKKSLKQDLEDGEKVSKFKIMFAVKFFLGIFSLYFGGELLVNSAVQISKLLGIESRVFSVIVVAAGTSLPEFFTALLTVFKKKDMGFIWGNILGSNVFNISFILGSLGIYNFTSPYKYYPEFAVFLLGNLVLIHAAFKKEFTKLHAIPFLIIYCGIIYHWLLVSA